MAEYAPPGTLHLPREPESGILLPSGDQAPATGRDATFLKDLGLWLPESADKSPVLRSRLRSLPIEQFLSLVSRISFFRLSPQSPFFAEMRKLGWDPGLDLRDYQLGFVVKILIDEFDFPGDRAWPSAEPGSQVALVRELANVATLVWPRADEQAVENEQILAMLGRVAHQQFLGFEDFERTLGRALVLYGECAAEPEAQQGMSLDDALRESVGLGIDDAWFLAFTLFALLHEGKRPNAFRFEELASSRDYPGLTADLITASLNWLARDYQGLRAASQTPRVSAQEGFEPYNFNPLIEFPIVRLPDGRSVVPIARYLVRRVTTGLYYDLIRSHNRDRVGNVIGRAFELYVRRLIEDLPSHGTVIGETPYGRGQATVEWILVEHDAIVIVECKRTSLLQKSKTTGSLSDLETDIGRDRGVAHGIGQMLRTRAAISRGEVAGVPSDRPVIGLLLTMDSFFLANTDYMRRVINRVLSAKSIDPGDFQYQLGSIADLDAVCSLLTTTKETLSALLLRKMVTPESYEVDLQQWAHNQARSQGRLRLPSHGIAEDKAFARWAEKYGTPEVVQLVMQRKRTSS